MFVPNHNDEITIKKHTEIENESYKILIKHGIIIACPINQIKFFLSLVFILKYLLTSQKYCLSHQIGRHARP